MPTTEEIMTRMGFRSDELGPHVAELRKVVDRQISEGLQNRSYGSWAPGDHTDEVRAKAFLEAEWAMQHGHCCEVKCMDSTPIDWRFSTKTMRWHLEIKPRRLLPWLGDRCREMAMHYRIWRDYLLGRSNPYRTRS